MNILALLFPREKKFYQMMEEQVSLVSRAASDFDQLVDKFDHLSQKLKDKYTIDISRKEKADDVLYTKMVRALKSTFITPMDREDIHQLVSTFDNIIDNLELLTLKLSAYKVKKINKYFKKQTEILYKEFKLMEKMIFSIRKPSEIEKMCSEIRSWENEGDKIYIKAIGELFGDSVKSKDIIILSDLYASIEAMIDKINEASLIIENIVVKYS